MQENIEIKKKINEIKKKAHRDAKQSSCIICGENQTSFCNSHLVPRMILKNIALNGEVLNANSAMSIPCIDDKNGVNNAGTFQFICRECDSKWFQEYENEGNLMDKPSDAMLAQIALKNIIMMLSKRYDERELWKRIGQEMQNLENSKLLEDIQNLDMNEYLNEIEMYKEIITNEVLGGFRILFFEKLPYVVQIAVQTPMAIYKDPDGFVVNDVYNMDENIRIQNMHVCVFPLKTESIVLVFHHLRDKNYRKIRHYFNSHSSEQNLQYINYLIFAYTENFYFSPQIKTIIEENEKLRKLSQENNEKPNFGFQTLFDEEVGSEPVKMEEIPNFLEDNIVNTI